MKFSFPLFLRDQLWGTPPPVVYDDLGGKVVMVVGANTGLGFEACVHFAKMKPAKLIMTARSRTKGEEAIQRLAQETSYQADLRLIDLSEFSSVKFFLEDFQKTESRLDILVMNAGVSHTTYTTTSDGWESTLQVNNLSTSWVVLRLLPLMQNSAKLYRSDPRVVLVSSELHYSSSMDKNILASPSIYEKLSSKKNFAKQPIRMQYNHSKLINVFFTRALAARISTDPSKFVLVNCPTPGFCHSDLRRNMTGVASFVAGLMARLMAYTTEEGSRQLVYGAVGGKGDPMLGKQLHGSFIYLCRVYDSSDFVMSEAGGNVQDKLWAETIDILAKQDPTLREIEKQCLTPSLTS